MNIFIRHETVAVVVMASFPTFTFHKVV